MSDQLFGRQSVIDDETGSGQMAAALERRARRHNLVVLSILLAAILPVGFVAWGLEPLSGDLTRIGGYSENDFGWTDHQERFDPPLAARDKYDRPYDIVVLGDSFTSNAFKQDQTDDGTYWPHYLMQNTGLSVLRLSLFHTDLSSVLANPVFQQHPPKLVILQVVERSLRWRLVDEVDANLGSRGMSCEASRPSPALKHQMPGPLAVEPVAWDRIRDTRFDFDAAVNQVYKGVLRDIVSTDTTEVVNLPLNRGGLFSSQVDDRLLVFRDDLAKESWPPDTIDRVRCNLLDAQNRVQANGTTRMVTMIVPDKLTTYADYLAAPKPFADYMISPLLAHGSLNAVDLLTPLRQAIGCGARDVYMPNDTHWGAVGHRIAAEALHRYIAKEKGEQSFCPAPTDADQITGSETMDRLP